MAGPAVIPSHDQPKNRMLRIDQPMRLTVNAIMDMTIEFLVVLTFITECWKGGALFVFL